ncbi:MAG: DNA translocase FtsK, partial [Muribaculaceae bacterium]|nr:DNA translocase FtsK [Muribaculaceae bacterium]
MPKYDTYTPEINYTEDSPATEEQNAPREPEQPRRRIKPGRQKKQKQKPQPEKKEKKASEHRELPSLRNIIKWFRSPSARILWGIFMGCITIYLAVSFVGYFRTCIEDQSKITGVAMGASTDISNPGGEGGARLAEFLINEGFGLGALVIIIWTGALSLKALVGKPRFRSVDFTIKCLVALITVSLIIGLITYSVHTPVNWGGYHGTYVNEFIIHFIGTIGAVLLSIFMLALFIVICLRDLVNWLLRLKHKHDEKRRILAEEKAARLAKEAEIKQMREQEQIDDLKAGETSYLPKTDNTDSTPKEEFQFSESDGSIYEYSELNDSVRPTSQVVDPYYTPGPAYRPVEDSDAVSGAEVPSEAIEKPEVLEGLEESEKLEKPDEIESAGKYDSSETSDTTGSNDPNDPKDLTDPNSSTGFTDSSDTSEASDAYQSEEQEEGVSPMVVNVNSISQTGGNRYRPDIEHFESHKYNFPPFNILREGVERVSVDVDEQNENKRKIEKTLLDFGIPITRIEATVGPTVTLYEIVPDTGVKISKIRSLVDDIALSLSAIGVRIIAPIPGKGTVGIEVANKDPQVVSMRTIIRSKKYQESRYNLPIALGSTISNDVYITDLAKMPHLLVAGATGQGKSVGLNAIIASLLYCKAPHEVKFVMIDPKQVEFSLYNKLKNYYLASIPGEEDEPVITEMSKVEATLNSLCIEMEQRYTLLKNAQTRNIEEYNAKIREGKLNPGEGHRFLPYIVVVVDEFGDLKMVLGNNVEMPIARLAQKARAVGMHVIIATQRPSTNVITGIIKANFPARISFKVTSGVDSKTILDTPGAQQLIGRGDMLIFNNSEMVRVQCAF